MPLLSVFPHAAGAAVQITYSLPLEAKAFVILRRTDSAFIGAEDPDAVVVKFGRMPIEAFVDCLFLTNGTEYFYCPYWTADGVTWQADPVKSATPAASYIPGNTDVLALLRERIDVAMQYVLARGDLYHDQGAIPVLTAPPASDAVSYPVVTLHLTQDASSGRGIGELVSRDVQLSDSEWQEYQGWHASVQIAVVGWSLNPDERAVLRKALRDAVIANLEVFDDAGMVTVDFSQQDVEDFQSFNVPMYQTIGTFSCTVPVVVATNVGVIEVVDASVVPLINRMQFAK